jgi:hypothetical protein
MQVDDKIRLDASKTFATSEETITDVEIQPEGTESFYSVYNIDEDRWFLDWAFETDGTKTASVRVTTDIGTKTKTYDFDVLTEVDDALFSNDNDLFPYEPNIYKYLPRGKSSFIYAHRAAQKKILAYLDEQRIWKDDRTRFTKEDIADKEEFNRWSIFQTLLIIFESIQVNNADVFQEKKLEYERDMLEARNRAALRLDKDGDGNTDDPPYDNITTRMLRR